MQSAIVLTQVGFIKIELPGPQEEVMPGVLWGAIDAFPSPAYWVYQVLSKKISGNTPQFRLGKTLAEEVGACLLGGHGIPAAVGLAAYERLKNSGVFEGSPPTEEVILNQLSEPLHVFGKSIRYRFATQKTKYLVATLNRLNDIPDIDSDRDLRDWLLGCPGIGLKTASWVVRNWLGSDNVAILDIHILRFGQLIGLFSKEMSVERDYKILEDLFLKFSGKIGVRASELDAVIWEEMAKSPRSVRFMLMESDSPLASPTNKSHAHSEQFSFAA